jgi:hypothetical protein
MDGNQRSHPPAQGPRGLDCGFHPPGPPEGYQFPCRPITPPRNPRCQDAGSWPQPRRPHGLLVPYSHEHRMEHLEQWPPCAPHMRRGWREPPPWGPPCTPPCTLTPYFVCQYLLEPHQRPDIYFPPPYPLDGCVRLPPPAPPDMRVQWENLQLREARQGRRSRTSPRWGWQGRQQNYPQKHHSKSAGARGSSQGLRVACSDVGHEGRDDDALPCDAETPVQVDDLDSDALLAAACSAAEDRSESEDSPTQVSCPLRFAPHLLMRLGSDSCCDAVAPHNEYLYAQKFCENFFQKFFSIN